MKRQISQRSTMMERVIASEQSAKSKYTLQLDGNDIQLMRVAVSELIPRVSDDAADRLRAIDYQLKALLSWAER